MPLSTLQTKAISALLISKTDKAAARLAGVSPKAIQKWRQIPEFAQALEAEQQAILRAVSGNVIGAAENLAKRVMHLSDNPNLEIGDLIRLVSFVLPFAIELSDRTGLAAKLEKLEKLHAKPEPAWEHTDD
jgi:DNA-binding transcriptional regulator YdaS (Cro superfamily)